MTTGLPSGRSGETEPPGTLPAMRGTAGGRGPGWLAGVRCEAEVSGHSVATPFQDMATL